MEWWVLLCFFFGGLAILLLSGLPVAFAFMLVNLVSVYFLWGGATGAQQLILSIDSSVSSFVLVPLPMFILMGTVMFHSGVAYRLIDVLDDPDEDQFNYANTNAVYYANTEERENAANRLFQKSTQQLQNISQLQNARIRLL